MSNAPDEAETPGDANLPEANDAANAPLRDAAGSPLMEEQAKVVVADLVFAKLALSYAIAKGLDAEHRIGEMVEVTFTTRPVLAHGEGVPEDYKADHIVAQIFLALPLVMGASEQAKMWKDGPKPRPRAPVLQLPPTFRRPPSPN